MPHVISVIESDTTRGRGTQDDPHRVVVQYHTVDGALLAERDPVAEERAARNAKTVEAWPRTIAEERAAKVEVIVLLEEILTEETWEAIPERCLVEARAIVARYRGVKA